MILLISILIGTLLCLVRAKISGTKIQIPTLFFAWLVPVAYFLQVLAIYLPAYRKATNLIEIVALYMLSSLLLLFFIIQNRHCPGFIIIGAGLLLNTLVAMLNGGLMPISPATIHQLQPNIALDSLHEGSRLGWSKDIILSAASTRLPFLSDQFLTPSWFFRREAFSLGDIFIALGAIWFLWKLAGPQTNAWLPSRPWLLERVRKTL